MLKNLQNTTLAVGAIAALALGGSAVAGAASGTSSNSTGTTTNQAPSGRPHDGPRGQQAALASDVAAKVKQAALDKVPGATVLRTEAGGPYNSAYHAHIKTSDGKLEVVLVNKSFEATAVQADNGPQGRGGKGGHGGAGETALTGDTKNKVEAAVLDKYPGATIERTETNNGSDAPYESHITTTDGKQLEVLVSKDFAVVAGNSMPAHP